MSEQLTSLEKRNSNEIEIRTGRFTASGTWGARTNVTFDKPMTKIPTIYLKVVSVSSTQPYIVARSDSVGISSITKNGFSTLYLNGGLNSNGQTMQLPTNVTYDYIAIAF